MYDYITHNKGLLRRFKVIENLQSSSLDTHHIVRGCPQLRYLRPYRSILQPYRIVKT